MLSFDSRWQIFAQSEAFQSHSDRLYRARNRFLEILPADSALDDQAIAVLIENRDIDGLSSGKSAEKPQERCFGIVKGLGRECGSCSLFIGTVPWMGGAGAPADFQVLTGADQSEPVAADFTSPVKGQCIVNRAIPSPQAVLPKQVSEGPKHTYSAGM